MAYPCPRGCIPRRNSAILAYRVTAPWHLGVGIHKLWRRAHAGFPPAVWSPSLSGWLPTTPPQGGSRMAATIAPAPKRHQRNLLVTLAATARKAALAHRHYRIAPPGDRPRETPSAASGRRPVVTVRCASDRAPDEHRHGAHHRLAGADHRDAGPAGAAARGTLRALPTAIRRTRVARPGPCARTATIQPWAAGSSGSTYAKSPAAASDASAARRRPAELRCVAAADRPPSQEPIAMSAGRASRADGRKRRAGSGAADGVPEGGAAAPTDATTEHKRHGPQPQTIERAIKRCIEISVRLGALEDEVPPAAGRVIVQCVDDIDEMQRWLEAASEHAGGRFGRNARAGRRTGPHEESRIPASDRKEPTRRPRRNDAHALIPQRPVHVRPQLRHPPGASVRDGRSVLFAAGPEMAGRTLPAMANLFDADGAVSPARAAAPAQDPRSG